MRIAPSGASLDRSGVKYVLNPYDEFAIEEALQRKEQAGKGSVTVMTVGSEQSAETLRAAIALGADEAVLLEAEESTDGLAVAHALAEEIRDRSFDLLLFGKQAIDDDNMQVPQMVAEFLELPCVTVVVDLEIEGSRATARREVEGGHEVVEFSLPAVISAQKGLNIPRRPNLKGIMAAKKKPLEQKTVDLPASGLELLALSEPPPRPAAKIVGEGPDAVSELIRLLQDEAKVL